jgi:UDP-N-acetylglucosamine acyltransferase
MNQTYIAHDCEIGSDAVLASSVLLAGNVNIGNQANLGMGTKVHQGISIGRLSMIGMGSVVTREIPDFMKAYGVPARIRAANEIGMERAGMPQSEIEAARTRASES